MNFLVKIVLAFLKGIFTGAPKTMEGSGAGALEKRLRSQIKKDYRR